MSLQSSCCAAGGYYLRNRGDLYPSLPPHFPFSCYPSSLFPSPRSSPSLPHCKLVLVQSIPPNSAAGAFPSALRFLESNPLDGGSDEESLDALLAELTPKEMTVLLKRQRDWRRALRLLRRIRCLRDYRPNPIHYNVVLRTLGRARRWDELRHCWLDMAKDGILPTNNTYATLIDAYGKAGLLKESLLWLKHMRARGISADEVCMNTVVRILKDSGHFDEGEKFFRGWCDGTVDYDVLEIEFEGSESISPNSFLLTELFKSGSRAPVPLKIASSAPDGSRRPRLAATYNTLIDLHGKAGKLQNASDAFAEMLRSGVSPDTITFNTMINICGSNGLISEAEDLFDKMRRRRIVPDTKTFNIFMSMYASLGNIESVLKYYHKMSESGLTPDTVSHRIILQALCERNMVREVEDVINKIIESGEFVDEQSVPVVVKMYINQGMLSETSMFLEKHCGSSSISSKNYAAIMDVYAEKGLWEEAEGVFYRKRGVGNKKEVVEYNVLIKAYGRGKQYDKAVSLFESMRNIGIWPDECTFNSLIQMLSGGDFPERATEFLRRMKDAGFRPRCETVSAIIASYSRKAMVDEALEIYQEMKPLGVEPNEVVYGLLVNMFAEAGKVEQALHFFSLMEESGFPPNHIILTSLMKAYKKAGCWREAQEVYAKMKTLEHGPDTIASNCMIDLYAELGMVSEAKLIFDDLRKNGEVNGVSYTTMIYLYKSLGMLEEAIDMAQEVQKAGLLTDCASYNSVLAAYAVTGKLKDCAYLIHEMIARKMLPDASVFRSIFGIVKKGGLPIEAVLQLQASYNEGKQFAREAIVTTLFSLVGLHDHALESCNLFLSARTRNPLDSYAYNALIYAYGASENIDKALNLYMQMQDAGLEPDTVTYVYLTICYGKARMVEGLRRIYGLLKYGEIEPSESLFKALMDAYENSGKHDLAELVEQEMKFRIHSPIGDESETEDDWDAYESETEDDLDAYESDNIDQDDDFSMNPSIL
ncbi:pentatricopeptide repeat-containing protein At1g73710-like [Zingiber officinale]|uniref:pentatricopeptide repeat-containing protein At1g73710-like n=1 Tax=Zingiber officinale TaxID=94328 RepID=UPI001C4D69C6|nr:pentatricopeptide repeat-containing protein At1g73710-like [Zingiber officinale]